jgi:hypothetical protein
VNKFTSWLRMGSCPWDKDDFVVERLACGKEGAGVLYPGPVAWRFSVGALRRRRPPLRLREFLRPETELFRYNSQEARIYRGAGCQFRVLSKCEASKA